MKSNFLSAAVATLGISFAQPAMAAFHLMSVTEVFAGSQANPTAQFVELQMYAGFQNLVSGHSIKIFDKAGTNIGTFTFPQNVTNKDSQDHILIATTDAATLFGITADLTMDPLIDPTGGKVCFDTIDCVAWGDFALAGEAATGTPFNQQGGGILLGASIQRSLARAGQPDKLDSADDTNNSAGDFFAAIPNPTNNARVTGTNPVTTCGNNTLEGIEVCDGTDLAGKDCVTLGGFTGGTLACNGTCDNFDTAGCEGGAPVCGNTIVEAGEACDDGNTAGGDGCAADCQFEVGLEDGGRCSINQSSSPLILAGIGGAFGAILTFIRRRKKA